MTTLKYGRMYIIEHAWTKRDRLKLAKIYELLKAVNQTSQREGWSIKETSLAHVNGL